MIVYVLAGGGRGRGRGLTGEGEGMERGKRGERYEGVVKSE